MTYAYMHDGSTITQKDQTGREREYRITIHPDYDIRAPWEEYDGYGIVSEWTTRDKRAGELILAIDGRSYRFYDFAGTMRKAYAEGWGVSVEVRAAMTAKLGRVPTTGEITEASVMRDYEYLRGWCNDAWHWVYVKVTDIANGKYEMLGGLSSDDGEAVRSVTDDMIDTLERAACAGFDSVMAMGV